MNTDRVDVFHITNSDRRIDVYKRHVLTNAAGGINTDFNAGDFMLINDHISCFVPSPLIGENDENFGVRFPDMSNCYNKDLQNLVKDVAKENEIELKEGIYVQLTRCV